jgi:hypothetical protein
MCRRKSDYFNYMETIRKTVAAMLATLFILTALAAQFLFNLEQKAFSPVTYQQAFANDQFYERMPSILAESVATGSMQGLPVSLQGLTQQNWENFFRDLLPPETLKLMGDQALASILAYLNDESDRAVLSLAPLKERMVGEPGTQAVINLMRTQPVCTLAEIARITMAVLNSQELSLCNPPEDMYPLVVPLIQGQLQITSAAIPGEVTLAHFDPAVTAGADPRDRMQLARFLMRFSPLVPLLFLLAMTAFAVRSLGDWLTWWGLPFFIIGFVGALVSLLAAPLISLLLLDFLSALLPSFLPQVLLANGSQLASAIVGQMLQPTALQGILLAVLGLAMLIAAFAKSRLRR